MYVCYVLFNKYSILNMLEDYCERNSCDYWPTSERRDDVSVGSVGVAAGARTPATRQSVSHRLVY